MRSQSVAPTIRALHARTHPALAEGKERRHSREKEERFGRTLNGVKRLCNPSQLHYLATPCPFPPSVTRPWFMFFRSDFSFVCSLYPIYVRGVNVFVDRVRVSIDRRCKGIRRNTKYLIYKDNSNEGRGRNASIDW